MAHTPTPWKLQRGFSDWNLPCQHDIYVGEYGASEDLLIAGVPSVTPNALGASAHQRELSSRQWENARLIVRAVNSFEAMREALRKGIPAIESAHRHATLSEDCPSSDWRWHDELEAARAALALVDKEQP